MNIAIVGAGRAGTSFTLALRRVGHDVSLVHHDQLDAIRGASLVLLTVPDDAIAATARRLAPSPHYVVVHVAGSRTLDELAPHERVGLMHPLAALPTGEVGARRLRGALFSVAGDDVVYDLVRSLDGRAITLRDDQRAAYHATASVASNHLVALLGSVEVLASSLGLTLVDFLPLAEQALEDVSSLGVERALTGPASRADMATIDAHLAAIPEDERSTYVALANAAFVLAERRRSSSLH